MAAETVSTVTKPSGNIEIKPDIKLEINDATTNPIVVLTGTPDADKRVLPNDVLLLSPMSQQKVLISQIQSLQSVSASGGIPWLLPNGTYVNAAAATSPTTVVNNVLPNSATDLTHTLSAQNNLGSLSALNQQQNIGNSGLLTIFNQLLTAVSLQQAISANQQQQTLLQQLVQQNSLATTATPTTIQIKTEPCVMIEQNQDSLDRKIKRARRRCKKDHVCPYCGKVCVRKDYLTKHIRIHTKEKPYLCGFCGQRFTQKGSLNAHVNFNCRGKHVSSIGCHGNQPASNHVLKRLKALQKRNSNGESNPETDESQDESEIGGSADGQACINKENGYGGYEEEKSDSGLNSSFSESMKLPLGPPDASSTDDGQSTNIETDISSESENSGDEATEKEKGNEADVIVIKAENFENTDSSTLLDSNENSSIGNLLIGQPQVQVYQATPSAVSSQHSTIAQILGHYNGAAPQNAQPLKTGTASLISIPDSSPGRPRAGRYKRTHACPYCGKVFARRDYLTKHIRIHTKERPYICNLCGDRFTQKGTLNSHLNCHKATGTFFCGVCNVRFASKRSLSKHLHSHSEEKAISNSTAFATEDADKLSPMKVAHWMATMNCNVQDDSEAAVYNEVSLYPNNHRYSNIYESGVMTEVTEKEDSNDVDFDKINSSGKKLPRNSRKQSMPMRLSIDEINDLNDSDDDTAPPSDDNISNCEFVITRDGITRSSNKDTGEKKANLGNLIDKLSQNAVEHSPYILKVPKIETVASNMRPKKNRRKSLAPAYRIANSIMELDELDEYDSLYGASDLSNDDGVDIRNSYASHEVVDLTSDESANVFSANAFSGNFQKTLAKIRKTILQKDVFRVDDKTSDNMVCVPLTIDSGCRGDESRTVSPRKNPVPILEQMEIEYNTMVDNSEIAADAGSAIIVRSPDKTDHIRRTEAKVSSIVMETNNNDSLSLSDKNKIMAKTELTLGCNSYSCPICSQVYTNELSFVGHLKTHRNDRWKCPLCKRVFGNEDRWVTHMKQHKQGGLHKCEICGQMLAKKRYLPIHMRTHTNERPYSCNICKRAFTQKGALNEHVRSHARKAIKIENGSHK